MKIYRIAKWKETFETANSKRFKLLTWVSLPANLNSNGYHAMLDEFGDDSAAAYGAWCALICIAAQAPTRGVLANSRGVGYSFVRISRETGFPAELFERLFAWASSDGVGWLEVVGGDDESEPIQASTEPPEPGQTTAKRQPNNSQTTAKQLAVSLPNPTQPNPTSTAPVPGEGRGEEKPKAGGQSLFAGFWAVVHRKEARGAAAKAFQKAAAEVAKRDGKSKAEAAAWITRRMAQFAKSPQARDDVKGKIHPATWLNQQRFDDDDAVWGLRSAGRADGRPPDATAEADRRMREIAKRREEAARRREAAV